MLILINAIAVSTMILGRFAFVINGDFRALLYQIHHIVAAGRILHVTGILTTVIRGDFRDLKRHACINDNLQDARAPLMSYILT